MSAHAASLDTAREGVLDTAREGVPDKASVLAEIRARRGEFESQQHVSRDIIEKLQALGIYRAFVPADLGGDELSPSAFCRLIEEISIADGSTGWVASFGVSAAYLAALPVATFREIYGNSPNTVFAGGLFPAQEAKRVDGGFLVNGRWKYGSGCMGASVIGVGITVAGGDTGGLPRMAVMPADKVRIEPNWDVMGMVATGSHDLVVDNVVVPEDWTFIRGGKPNLDQPIYRYPALALAAQVLAVVGLGVARSALDEFIDKAGPRPGITGAPGLADRAYVQSGLAKAEATLRSARAWFYEATDEAWEVLTRGEALSVKQTAALRLAATNAAHVGATVTRTAFELAGTPSIMVGHPLLRLLNDAMVVAQHAFLGEGTWQSGGRVLLNLPSQPGYP
jgi:alkylation response protein AidB-like acyl-CoA dehydrogenase